MATIDTVITDLRELESKLTPRQLRNSVRNTLAKEARKARKLAQQELKRSGIHHASKLATNIRCGACRDSSGYYVAVRNTSYKDMHTNRRGLEKPIAFWIQKGTKERETRETWRRRKTRYTGVMRQYDFLSAAEKAIPESVVRMGQEYDAQVRRIIAKTIRT